MNSSSILPALSPLSIVRMLWKRKVTIGVLWTCICALVVVVVQRIPPMYQADALVVVDSQKIPEKYVSSTVVSDAQDRLATISLEILSNGQLQKIMQDFDLYRNERQTHFTEDVLQMMRKDIDVTPEKAWTGRTASFRVSYQGRDPVVVAKVANRLADVFVQENFKNREVQAEGTAEFIDSQLKEAKKKLDDLESAVSRYKVKHNGELPEQETSLNGVLSRLQVELEANRDAVNRAHQTQVGLRDALSVAEDAARMERSQADAAAAASLPAPAPAAPKPLKQSEVLEAQLRELRLHYSDEYPDVRRVKAQLAQARLDEAAETAADAPAAVSTSSKPGPGKPPARPAAPAPRVAAIQSQLNLANQELANREAEQRRILGEISAYQSRVGALPLREQEMAQITRDYEISKANYRSLLDKKINAAMATDMELRQKSERFTVADPARVPNRPFKPRRLLLEAAGCVLGLAAALAVAFGKELQESTLLGEWELPEGVTVLGRLPFIAITPNVLPGDAGAGRRRTAFLALLSSAVLSLLGIVAGFYFMARHGS